MVIDNGGHDQRCDLAIRMTWTAWPITSAGRFSPFGPLGVLGHLLCQLDHPAAIGVDDPIRKAVLNVPNLLTQSHLTLATPHSRQEAPRSAFPLGIGVALKDNAHSFAKPTVFVFHVQR
jgi:hypothetical protein